MCTYRLKSLICVVAFALTAAFAAPVFAQDGAWGSDVEDFSTPQRPPRLAADAGGDADFSAALEAAAAAEGRTTAAAGGNAAAPEFVPKNEITIIKNPKADSAAGEKKKKETKPKAEGSGEKLGNTMGARLGVGNDIDLSLGFGIGLSDVYRIGVGLNIGLFGTNSGYGFNTYEGFGFFDWNINISDDGALRWFVGPGATFGRQRAEKDNWSDKLDSTWTVGPWITTGPDGIPRQVDTVYIKYKKENKPKMGNVCWSLGIGARTGLEVDLSFIDPDHALSMLRSSSVSLDVRLLLYLFLDKDELKNYPAIMPTLGITYNYVFGSGVKGKEKEKEKK